MNELKILIFISFCSNSQKTPTHPPLILQLDLTDINSLPDKVDEVEKAIGSIDVLINNGGVSIRADILSTAMDVDIKVMLVNYFGGVALTKGLVFLKRKQKFR